MVTKIAKQVDIPAGIQARSDAAKNKVNQPLPQATLALVVQNPVDNEPIQAELALIDASDRRNAGLTPQQYVQRDFFLCDFVDVSFRDDMGTMDAPMFSLSKKKDLEKWEWTSEDGTKSVEVIPSILGRATMYDKDVLIYLGTQITHGLNSKRRDAANKKVRFVVYNYLTSTNKATGKGNYKTLEAALDRLKGTTIKTNILTGGVRTKESFNIIDKVKIIEKSPTDEKMIALEVTLSDWFYNGFQSREVLAIDPDYFTLKKALEKRLYEIARKLCGDKGMFTISDRLLFKRTGSRDAPRKVRYEVKEIAEQDKLPGYRYSYNAATEQWTIYSKDHAKVAKALAKRANASAKNMLKREDKFTG